MREVLCTMLVGLMIGFLFFPDHMGKIAHKAYNEFRAGWESVR